MLSNSESSQVEAMLQGILKHNPALSTALATDGDQAQGMTQLMEPVLSVRDRCQDTDRFIQAVSIGRSIFLVTNLSAGGPMQATRPASSWLFGRGSACAVSVAEPSVSRRHAVIGYRGDAEFFIMDVGSRNGTQVNSVAITAGTRQRLQDGTLIQLGDLRVEFFIARTRTDLSHLDLTDGEGPTEATGLGSTW